MPRSEGTREDVVLRILDGRSSRPEIILEARRPIPPLAIGANGAWRIDAKHVASVHVMLAFNGKKVFVCTYGGTTASLDGVSLHARWTEAAIPSELRFGTACVRIERRAKVADSRHVAHAHRVVDEAVTVFADLPLPAAARRPYSDDAATSIADMAIPEAAKRCIRDSALREPMNQSPSIRRPNLPPLLSKPARARAAPTNHVVVPNRRATLAPPPPSSMSLLIPSAKHVSSRVPWSQPPTLPSDDLVAPPQVSRSVSGPPPSFFPPASAAGGRPSSTLASPGFPTNGEESPGLSRRDVEPRGVSSAAPLAIDASVPGTTGEVAGGSSRAANGSPFHGKLDAFADGWRRTSLVTKASGALLLVMMPVAAVAMRAASRDEASFAAQSPVAASTALTTALAAAHASTAPATATPATAAQASAAPTTRANASPRDEPNAAPRSATALRDTRSPERRALDAAAAGSFASAARQYDTMSAAHPENVAFREAVRILRERASSSEHD